MKKLFGILLSVLMVFAIMVPVSAEEVTASTADELIAELEKAGPGTTVKLTNDVESTGSHGFEVKAGVTLDLNGYTITRSTKGNAVTLYGDSTLTNGAIFLEGDAKYAVHAYQTEGATVSNLTIEDTSDKFTGILVNGAKLTVEKVDYIGNLSSYEPIELAKGSNVGAVPSVTIVDSYLEVYADKDQLSVLNHYGDTYSGYNSLQTALNEAEKGTTVKLLKDLTESVVVSKDTEVELNLNGYTLTNDDGKHTITNNGTLIILGDGTVDNVSHKCGALVNNGSVTVVNGTLTRSKEAGSSSKDSGGNSWYVIQNNGNMTFLDGTVKSTSKFSSLINNNEGSLDVKGGNFSNGFIVFKNEPKSILLIEGGKVEGAQSVQSYGTTEITGGDLKGTVTIINYADFDSTAIISGGNIDGDVVGRVYTDNKDTKINIALDGAHVSGDLMLLDKDKKPLEENNALDIDVLSGSFDNNVKDYLNPNVAFLNVDGTYYAGDPIALNDVAMGAKKTIVVFQGISELMEIPTGVELENKSGDIIVVNDKEVKAGDKLEVVDLSGLKDLIAKFDGLKKDDYTPESWKVYADAIDDAKLLLGKDGLTQQDIQDMIDTLEAAEKGLKKVEPKPDPKPETDPTPVVDKTELKNLIATLSALDGKLYTKESYDALTVALDAAKAVLANEKATEGDVKAAVDMLTKAQNGLVKLGEVKPEPKPEQKPEPKPEPKPEIVVPNTGVTFGLGASTIVLAGAVVAYTLNKKNSK